MELMIFDRWGEQLYTTTEMGKPWDGTFDGGLVQNDVYVYRLKYNAHCDQGNEKLIYGHVTVVR
jgi:gliding motility-associated-like protein